MKTSKSNFKRGTEFNVGGKTFISGGTMIHPEYGLRIVLVCDPITGAQDGWYFLQELNDWMKTGFVKISVR